MLALRNMLLVSGSRVIIMGGELILMLVVRNRIYAGVSRKEGDYYGR